MIIPPFVLYVLIFAGVLVVAQAAIGALLTRSERLTRVNRRLRLLDHGQNNEQVLDALIRRRSTFTFGNERLQNLLAHWERMVSQADIHVTPMRLIVIAAGIAGSMWLASLAFIVLGHAEPISNGLGALIGAAVLSAVGVVLWVQRRRDARIKKIDEQLPLALDVMTRALRAGHPVVAAMQLTASEMPDPLGSEFGLAVDEINFGAELRDALEHLADRTGSSDVRYLGVAINIQIESGGNLAEVLASLARTIRGRAMLRKRVHALSSEGRMSAYILSALPALVIGFFLLANPAFYVSKINDPIFIPTAAGVGMLYLLGWLMISRIVNFKY